jgi:hypothetical protein
MQSLMKSPDGLLGGLGRELLNKQDSRRIRARLPTCVSIGFNSPLRTGGAPVSIAEGSSIGAASKRQRDVDHHNH